MKNLFEEFVNNYNALGKEEKVKFWDEFNSRPETGPLAKDLIESWSMVPTNDDDRFFFIITDRETGEKFTSIHVGISEKEYFCSILKTTSTEGFYMTIPCATHISQENGLRELHRKSLILHSRNIHLYSIEMYERTEESKN